MGETIVDYRDPEWVAEQLGLDKNTVYKFLQDGMIPAIQIGRKWLISEARLAQWLAEETDRQTAGRREAASSADRTVQKFDDYTDAARRALRHAHTEARRYERGQIGQEHLLLGLMAEGQTAAGRALRSLGVEAGTIRRAIEAAGGATVSPVPRRLGRTAEAKRAMRLAVKLAGREKGPVDTGHLLLGILLARRGAGFEILTHAGVTRRRLKEALRTAAGDSKGSTKENP